MTSNWKAVLRVVAAAVAGLLGLQGLRIAAEYGSGSHYQGGIALFLFMVLVIVWQIHSVRFER